jgi:phage gp36-like protein
MPYTTQQRLETAIPGPHLIDALDDNGDGQIDAPVLAEILQSASDAVDAALSGLFTTPFVGLIPAAVSEAAFTFACERIYDRRLATGDKNPWADRADTWRTTLAEIGAGKRPLDAALEKSFTPGAAVTLPATIDGSLA